MADTIVRSTGKGHRAVPTPFHAAVAGAGFAAVLLMWTWGMWPDLLVDFGRELYLPWQITKGKVIYRDLASFNGPLSPYINALWFRLFGVSVRSLVIGNALVTTLLAVLLYHLLREIGNAASAAGGLLFFIGTFSCLQLRPIANYNFLAPYSHELTHGIVLSFAAFVCLARLRQRPLLAAGAAGLLTGLTFLTKAEAFAACLVGAIVWFAADSVVRRRSLAECGRLGTAMAVALAMPITGAVALLSAAMPLPSAWSGILAPWRPVLVPTLGSQLGALPFYRTVLGTLHLHDSLRAIALWSGWLALMLTPPYLLSLRRPPDRATARPREPALLVTVLISLVSIGTFRISRYWPEVATPLPLVLILWGATLTVSLFRRLPPGAVRDARLPIRLGFITFSGVLMTKIVLSVTFGHYGFALAMPAAMCGVVLLLDVVPAHIQQLNGRPRIFVAAAAALLLTVVAGNLAITDLLMKRRDVAVGTGADRLWSDTRGLLVNQALAAIQRDTRPDETLVVMPEGVMLNYLARRDSSIPFVNFMPPELLIFGERKMIEALDRHPPDYVVLMHKDTSEYGVRFFGTDYGLALGAWLDRHYERTSLFGDLPLQDSRFGVMLLRRSAPTGR